MVGLVQKPAPETEVHTSEIDWKKGIPKWMALALLISSMGINTLFGSIIVGLIVDRFHTIEKSQNDPKWDILAQLAQTQARHSAMLDQSKEDTRTLHLVNARVIELQARIDMMNNRLMRKGL